MLRRSQLRRGSSFGVRLESAEVCCSATRDSVPGSGVLRVLFGSSDLGGARWRCWGVGAWDHCGQATKGVWGMSWRQEAMKGVEGCDKPGEAVKRALIPGFLNDRALNP